MWRAGGKTRTAPACLRFNHPSYPIGSDLAPRGGATCDAPGCAVPHRFFDADALSSHHASRACGIVHVPCTLYDVDVLPRFARGRAAIPRIDHVVSEFCENKA